MKSKLTLESLVYRNKEIVFSNLDGEAVLFSLQNSQYYGFNETLTIIWNKLENPVKVADIIAELLYLYDVDNETCQQEVMSALELLLEKKIIEVNN